MKLEIPITEVQQFLNNYFKINIGLKNYKKDEIEVNYLVSFYLAIKEVKNDELVLKYDLKGLLNLLAKSAKLIFAKRVDDSPIEWNSKTNEVTFNFKKVKELSNFFKHFYILEIHFENGNILVIISSKLIK